MLSQAWADAFRSSPDLTGVVQIYEELKRKGIDFPTSELETLSPIHTPQRVGGAARLRFFFSSVRPDFFLIIISCHVHFLQTVALLVHL